MTTKIYVLLDKNMGRRHSLEHRAKLSLAMKKKNWGTN